MARTKIRLCIVFVVMFKDWHIRHMSDIAPDEHRNYLQLHLTSVERVLISIRLDKHCLTSMTFCFPVWVLVIYRKEFQAEIINLFPGLKVLFDICEESVVEVQILYAVRLSDIISKFCISVVLNFKGCTYVCLMPSNLSRRTTDNKERVNTKASYHV